MKNCFRCKQDLPLTEFIPNKTGVDGLNGWCRPCTKDRYLESKYGINLVTFNQMLIDQDHKCKICKTSEPGGRRNTFAVDHSHVTGQVRGLLCSECNTGLGKFRDMSELLRKAADYLESDGV